MMVFMPHILAQADPISWTALIVYQLIVMAIGIGLAYALRRKPEAPEPSGASAFTVPTAMVGRAVPHVRGKRIITGYNCLTPIFNFMAHKREKKHGAFVFYEYFFSIWFGVCRIADGIKQIRAGGKAIWPTIGNNTAEAADGEINIDVYAPYIFGGYETEGGQAGSVRIMYGSSAQTTPTYIQSFLGVNTPPHRGMVSILFGTNVFSSIWGLPETRGYYWGVTTYPKWPSFLVKSTDEDTSGAEIWQSAYSNVGYDDDFNPIHAIYEWITDVNIGRGQGTARIGASFATAAATTHGEGYGISYILDSAPDELIGYIDTVCSIIDAILWYDVNNATYEIELIRSDYDSGSIETFNETDFWISKFTRPSPGKTPSRIIVHYMDRLLDTKRTACADDIALLEIQGSQPVVLDLDFEAFVCDTNTAEMIAEREQAHYSAMPATLTLKCLRTMSHLHPGSIIEISYPAMEITSMILRVLSTNGGELGNSEITIEAMEDVFGSIYSTFGTPAAPPTGPTGVQEETTNNMYWSTSITESGPY